MKNNSIRTPNDLRNERYKRYVLFVPRHILLNAPHITQIGNGFLTFYHSGILSIIRAHNRTVDPKTAIANTELKYSLARAFQS